MKSIYVTDIKLASILIAFGVPRRECDPTTCEIRKRPDGQDQKQYSFWFDVQQDDHSETAEKTIKDFAAAKEWETLNRDEEDPLRPLLRTSQCFDQVREARDVGHAI